MKHPPLTCVTSRRLRPSTICAPIRDEPYASVAAVRFRRRPHTRDPAFASPDRPPARRSAARCRAARSGSPRDGVQEPTQSRARTGSAQRIGGAAGARGAASPGRSRLEPKRRTGTHAHAPFESSSRSRPLRRVRCAARSRGRRANPAPRTCAPKRHRPARPAARPSLDTSRDRRGDRRPSVAAGRRDRPPSTDSDPRRARSRERRSASSAGVPPRADATHHASIESAFVRRHDEGSVSDAVGRAREDRWKCKRGPRRVRGGEPADGRASRTPRGSRPPSAHPRALRGRPECARRRPRPAGPARRPRGRAAPRTSARSRRPYAGPGR